MTWRGRSRTTAPSAYGQVRVRATGLWGSLGSEPDPAARRAVYRELCSAYTYMAESWVEDDVPGGYDGDFRADLGDMAALCWVLAESEEALAAERAEGRPLVPLQNIPGASASSPLAAAWEQFWQAGNRADRARLLRGHTGAPARRGEARQAGGIVPLSAGHVGSAVASLLEAAADTEDQLAAFQQASR